MFRLIRGIISAVLIFCFGYFFGVRGVRFYKVESESMSPSIEKNDRFVGIRCENPERGMIGVFEDPEDADGTVIKRIVAVSGDTIEIRNGGVYRNREKLNEPYVREKPVYRAGPVRIKSDEVYVLGDNRNNSADSSIWGPIPVSTMRSRIIARYWPFKRLKIFHSVWSP
jgi:signal peptidase I